MTEDEIIDGVLLREGSTYSNDPADHGGPTKFGITLRVLREWRHDPVLDASAVEALDEAEARAIYRARYIEAPGFGYIANDWARAFMVDMAVLQGQKAAIKILQRALRTVTVDGVCGPETLAAIARANPEALKKNLITLRVQHLIACALADVPDSVRDTTDLKWLKGWWNRVASFL